MSSNALRYSSQALGLITATNLSFAFINAAQNSTLYAACGAVVVGVGAAMIAITSELDVRRAGDIEGSEAEQKSAAKDVSNKTQPADRYIHTFSPLTRERMNWDK